MTSRDHINNDPVGAVHKRAKEFEAHLLEHSRDAEAGDTIAGGYRALGTAKPASDGGTHGKRKSDDIMRAVMDSAEDMKRHLDRLYDEQQALYDRLSDIEVKIDKLEQVARALDAGDMPEIGDDGKLKDAELEAMIAAEEKRLGRSIDRSDPQVLVAIFAAEHQRSIQERDETLAAIDKNAADIEALQDGRSLDQQVDRTSDIEREAALRELKSNAQHGEPAVSQDAALDQFTF